MIDWLYDFLEKIGYIHPIHPPLVHVPIGTIVAALVFGLIGRLLHREDVAKAARYCIILAFVSSFPAIFLGITDWQRFFNQAWLFPIKVKFVLAAVLLILLAWQIVLQRRKTAPGKDILLSFLALVTVTGLGYFGAELVFAKVPPVPTAELAAGQKLYRLNCGACHPQGSNTLSPTLPVKGAPQLKDFDTFLSYLRNPVKPDGTRGMMPGYPKAKISDQQARDIYDYITQVLEKPRGK